MINNELLKKITIFEKLNIDQVEKLNKHCELAVYRYGDKLFTENDDAISLWIIIDGKVDLRFELPGKHPTTEDNTVTSVKGKIAVAKILGWSCFVSPYKMRLSAYCTSKKCEIIRIKKVDLLKLFQDDPKMGCIIMSYLVEVVGYRFQQFQDVVAKSIGQNLLAGW